MRVNQSFWEGDPRTRRRGARGDVRRPRLAHRAEDEGRHGRRLGRYSSPASRLLAVAGVFFFTVLMVTREGMETALMLIQVRNSRFILGSLLGMAAAAAMSWAWAHYGHRIDVKRFFQVTGLFLLLFTIQILFYSIHEFSEAEILGRSGARRFITRRSLTRRSGIYGKWISMLMVGLCAAWLVGVSIKDRFARSHAA